MEASMEKDLSSKQITANSSTHEQTGLVYSIDYFMDESADATVDAKMEANNSDLDPMKENEEETEVRLRQDDPGEQMIRKRITVEVRCEHCALTFQHPLLGMCVLPYSLYTKMRNQSLLPVSELGPIDITNYNPLDFLSPQSLESTKWLGKKVKAGDGNIYVNENIWKKWIEHETKWDAYPRRQIRLAELLVMYVLEWIKSLPSYGDEDVLLRPLRVVVQDWSSLLRGILTIGDGLTKSAISDLDAVSKLVMHLVGDIGLPYTCGNAQDIRRALLTFKGHDQVLSNLSFGSYFEDWADDYAWEYPNMEEDDDAHIKEDKEDNDITIDDGDDDIDPNFDVRELTKAGRRAIADEEMDSIAMDDCSLDTAYYLPPDDFEWDADYLQIRRYETRMRRRWPHDVHHSVPIPIPAPTPNDAPHWIQGDAPVIQAPTEISIVQQLHAWFDDVACA